MASNCLSISWNAQAFRCGLRELSKYWTRGRTVNGDTPSARILSMRLDRWAGPLFSGRAGFRLVRDAFHYKPKVTTFAETLRREQTMTASIERNPFTHLLPCMRDGWSKNWLARPGQDAISH